MTTQKLANANLGAFANCLPGQEHYVTFMSKVLRGEYIQYDYRTPDGMLFSCVAKTVDDARIRRDAWLTKETKKTLEEYERLIDEAWAKYKLIEAAAYAEFAQTEKAAQAELESGK